MKKLGKKKLIPIIAILFLGAFAAYTMAKPKPKDVARIKGTVYVLPKEFLLNLSDGRYAKLTVALVLAPGQSTGATAEGAAPTDGLGTLPEEAAVRDIVTNVVTNQSGDTLINPAGRERVKRQILLGIQESTDVKASQVLLPDVAVQ